MADNALEHVYRRYITTLNERRFEDLGHYVHDDLTYNGQPWTMAEYRRLLKSDIDRIPDLRYEILALVADDTQVAARLWFDCTPTGAFLGIQTSGLTLHFAEHVFYEFQGSRIKHVRSLIDRDAVRQQSQPTDPASTGATQLRSSGSTSAVGESGCTV